jgi:hypothetical protein
VAHPGDRGLPALVDLFPIRPCPDHESSHHRLRGDHCAIPDLALSTDGAPYYCAMTKREILDTYGMSVYQIRLELAMRLFGGSELDAEECFKVADEFVIALQDEEVEDLTAKFV